MKNIKFVFNGFKERNPFNKNGRFKFNNILTSFRYYCEGEDCSTKVKNKIKNFSDNLDYFTANTVFQEMYSKPHEGKRIDSFFNKEAVVLNDLIKLIDQCEDCDDIVINVYFECCKFLFDYIIAVRPEIKTDGISESFKYSEQNIINQNSNLNVTFEYMPINDIIHRNVQILRDSWAIIDLDIFNKMADLISIDIKRLDELNSFIEKRATIFCLDQIGITYMCLSRMQTNVYNFIQTSCQLVKELKQCTIDENEDKIKFYTNLFSSMFYELIKSIRYSTIKSKIDSYEKDVGTNLCFAVKNTLDLIKEYISYSNNTYIDKIYKQKYANDNQYAIMYDDFLKLIESAQGRLIDDWYDLPSNKEYLNYFVSIALRNTRNPMFHTGLSSLDSNYDDNNNYLYGYIKNRKNDSINMSIRYIVGAMKFVINSFLFSYKTVFILIGKKSIESYDNFKSKIESWISIKEYFDKEMKEN